MSMKDRVLISTALFLCAALVSGFGMVVQQEDRSGNDKNITCVTNKEERMENRKIAITFDDGPDRSTRRSFWTA